MTPITEPPVARPAASSACAAVFDVLAAEIIGGRHAPGARLPAERELAQALGASRATLREALRRLVEWGLVEVRRGSGVIVRDRRRWSLHVLPIYLRTAAPLGEAQPLVRDLLAVRRSLVTSLIGALDGRGISNVLLEHARTAARRAWSHRNERRAFIELDFEVLRLVLEAAGFLPAVWLLNDLAGVYKELATQLAAATDTPADYLATHGAVLDALSAGDGATAGRLLTQYLQRTDEELLAQLAGRAAAVAAPENGGTTLRQERR